MYTAVSKTVQTSARRHHAIPPQADRLQQPRSKAPRPVHVWVPVCHSRCSRETRRSSRPAHSRIARSRFRCEDLLGGGVKSFSFLLMREDTLPTVRSAGVPGRLGACSSPRTRITPPLPPSNHGQHAAQRSSGTLIMTNIDHEAACSLREHAVWDRVHTQHVTSWLVMRVSLRDVEVE